MTTKQINDCISYVAMALTDKAHSLEFKLNHIEQWAKGNGIDNKDVIEHIHDTILCCLREE